MHRQADRTRTAARRRARTNRMGQGVAASALATGAIAVVALWKSASADVAAGTTAR